MKRVPSFLIPLAWLLSGCVGMSYHARDPIWGLGFSETRLAPNVWRVMYRGYYIPEAQAGDYAMLRAAEVVKAAGYPYFVVENERSSATVMGSGYGYVYAGSGSAFACSIQLPGNWTAGEGAFREAHGADRWFSMRRSSAPKSSANTRSKSDARHEEEAEEEGFRIAPPGRDRC